MAGIDRDLSSTGECDSRGWRILREGVISPNREPFSLQGLEGWQQAGREVFARDRKPMYVRT